MPAVGRAEVGERKAALVPRADDLVAQAQERCQAPANLPVVLREDGDVVRVAIEWPTVGVLIPDVTRKAKEEIREGIARGTGVEAILTAETDPEAEAVARHVARP